MCSITFRARSRQSVHKKRRVKREREEEKLARVVSENASPAQAVYKFCRPHTIRAARGARRGHTSLWNEEPLTLCLEEEKTLREKERPRRDRRDDAGVVRGCVQSALGLRGTRGRVELGVASARAAGRARGVLRVIH